MKNQEIQRQRTSADVAVKRIVDGPEERDKGVLTPPHEFPRLREPPLRRKPSRRGQMRILCVIILKAPSARFPASTLVAEGGEAERVGTASERSRWRAFG